MTALGAAFYFGGVFLALVVLVIVLGVKGSDE